MKHLSKKDIQKIVSDKIKTFPRDYRCHEIARALKEIFLKKGFSFEVRDGYAFYCFSTFFKEAYKKNCKLFLEAGKSDELNEKPWAYATGYPDQSNSEAV